MSWTPPAGLIPKRDVNVTKLSAAGAGVGTISNGNSAAYWVIVQLSVITEPTISGCTCTVKPPVGSVDTSYFAGTGDVAGDEPHFLYTNDFLTLTWTGGPPNGQAIGTYYFYEVPY